MSFLAIMVGIMTLIFTFLHPIHPILFMLGIGSGFLCFVYGMQNISNIIKKRENNKKVKEDGV